MALKDDIKRILKNAGIEASDTMVLQVSLACVMPMQNLLLQARNDGIEAAAQWHDELADEPKDAGHSVNEMYRLAFESGYHRQSALSIRGLREDIEGGKARYLKPQEIAIVYGALMAAFEYTLAHNFGKTYEESMTKRTMEQVKEAINVFERK
jgi:hypothetical protein